MVAKFFSAMTFTIVIVASIFFAEMAYANEAVQHQIAVETHDSRGVAQQAAGAPEKLNEELSLQQQRIQRLQSDLIEQDIKNQRDIVKLQEALDHQEEAMRKLAHDGNEDSHLSLMLTAMGCMIAILTLAISLFGAWGYFSFKQAAIDKAEDTVKKEIEKGSFNGAIGRKAEDTVKKEIEKGSFDGAMLGLAARVAMSGVSSETADELDQEENENRGQE